MKHSALACIVAGVAVLLLGAAPQSPAISFGPATQTRLDNGVIIASQPSNDLPLVGAQIFLPAGLAQQAPNKAGVAAIAAALVLDTPVEGSTSLSAAAAQAGGSISFTLDPMDTRFYLECRDADFPRLLHDLRTALSHPDMTQLTAELAKARAGADALTNNPLEAAYVMVRQVRYRGTGFALPDQGSVLTIANLSSADVQGFAASYLRGSGTIVALEGAVGQPVTDAARREFASFPRAQALPTPAISPVKRLHQVVANRNVAAPWVAIAYEAPNQYSSDFAAMLVIEALLGSGGDVHALAFESNEAVPDDFIGAYYQYEAKPGSMIVFLGGESANLDQSVRDLETGVARLRGDNLSAQLIADAKRAAIGDYLISVTNLEDLGWLLGRSAASPEGVAFENNVPVRINAVTAADIQRVARHYLTNETIAIVLPPKTTDGQ
jgi:zinc protease